jgi:hypothetical protein
MDWGRYDGRGWSHVTVCMLGCVKVLVGKDNPRDHMVWGAVWSTIQTI